MKPEYVAVKSAWKAVTPFRVVFFWLIIPLIIMIAKIIILKHEKIEFYQDRVVQKSGVFSRHERKSIFSGVISVSVNQSIVGRMFHYGDVGIDVVGKWDIDTKGIKNPDSLKAYLETRVVSPMSTTVIA